LSDFELMEFPAQKESAGNYTYRTLRYWYTRQQISERPRLWHERSSLSSRCLKITSFQCGT
jgi:hypothetical protein